ncbi:MAG: M28 family peptidase [Planctomycetes bacterium]|nr:M28 family peptidase [Planctomycetota bacterium]
MNSCANGSGRLRPQRAALLAALLVLPLRTWASAPPEAPAEAPPTATVSNPTATPIRPSVKAEIDKGELLGHIQFLASEELRGREAGTPDQLKAAEYIAAEFKRYGLAPFGDEKDGQRTYFQEFNLPASKGLGEHNALTMKLEEKETVFEVRKHFAPFSFSKAKAQAQGGVAFAGYGIVAPEYGYDDFKNLNLEGKWALILRYEPQEQDPASKFAGKEMTRHAGLPMKISQCAKHKAVGVLIVTGPKGHEKEPEQLTDGSGPVDEGASIPAFQITREAANAILDSSKKTLGDLQGEIDKDLACHSFALKDVTLTGSAELDVEPRPTRNILAFLEGSDEKLKSEYVILGAHSDHVGLGKSGSLLGPAGVGKIHPGADDNASGTAGLLEIAQNLAALKPAERPKRAVILIAFSGEEKGLLGSAYYVLHPKAPLKDTVAMVNLDMIGRSEDGGLQITGLGSAKGMTEIVKAATAGTSLHIALGSGGDGPSDHATFYHAGLPVLFFFTGIHPDYHRPTDTWEKINAPVAEQTAAIAEKALIALADLPARLEYVNGGPKAYMGVGADHVRERNTQGYPIGSVAPGSPADEAGLKVGDTISHINGQRLSQPMDLFMTLIDFGPGDTIDLTVKRGDEKLALKVHLAERKP